VVSAENLDYLESLVTSALVNRFYFLTGKGAHYMYKVF